MYYCYGKWSRRVSFVGGLFLSQSRAQNNSGHQTKTNQNGHLAVQNQVCADILSVHISLHIVYKQADVHAKLLS